MNDRLRAVIDRAEQLPDADQEALARLLEEELDEREWESSAELRAALDASRAEIAAGDYITLEELDRQRRERQQ